MPSIKESSLWERQSLSMSHQTIMESTRQAEAAQLPLGSRNPYNRSPRAAGFPFPDLQLQQNKSTTPREQSEPDTVVLPRSDGGSPYEVSYESQKVKVAQDMYDGQNPPQYNAKKDALQRPDQPESMVNPSQHQCRTCGRERPALNNAEGEPLDCARCRKRQTTPPASIQDHTSLPQLRSVSDSVVRQSMAHSGTEMPGPRRLRPCCQKCGRSKRSGPPVSMSRNFTAPVVGIDSSLSTPANSSTIPWHTAYHSSSVKPAPLRQLPKIHAVNTPVGIDVTPPTASTYRAPSVRYLDESPLVNGGPRKKLSRTASIASTISRTFSRRKKGKLADHVPSHQQSARRDHSPSRLIDMINHAIRGAEAQDYTRLGAGEAFEDRPGSPFSFTNKSDENQAFEMTSVKVVNPTSQEGYFDWPWSAPTIVEENDSEETIRRPEHARSKSEAFTSATIRLQDDIYLANPDQKPPLSRFRSLRGGIDRATSVTRSTSLRRFNSLKKTPTLWYRSDMVLEGAIGAY